MEKKLTDEQRVVLLEKKVKRLETLHVIHVAIIVLTFVGLTTMFTKKIDSLKSKIKLS